MAIRPQTDGFEAELASALGGVPDQDILNADDGMDPRLNHNP